MEAGKPADVSKGKYGPESRMFDALKGTEVLISWNNGDPGLRAKLIWIDRYTLGVKLRKVLAPGHGFNSERSKQSENGGHP